MSAGDAAAEAVTALVDLDLEGLRSEWRRRYGPAPKLRSADLLRLSLAWRLQAEAHGGLNAGLRRRIRQGPGAPARADYLAPGVQITREWRGETYQIARTGQGYAWNGKSYASLSAVAQAITGVKRNGPKFFGLREADA